jgi:hypothetical protein
MMLKLSEPEDFSDHSPIVSNFDVLEQCAIVGSRSCK